MDFSDLTTTWHRLAGTQPAPPVALLPVTAVAALAVILPHRLWRVARHVVTIAHEGGHALAALLTGRRLAAIRLHSDTSGLTVSRGRPGGPGMVVTMLAGYVAPSLLGLLGAGLLATDRITLLLWTGLVLLPLMLVMIRNAFGVISVVTTIAILIGVVGYTSARVQAAFAYALVWFLLFGGVRPVFELHRMRRRGRLPDSDADQLARLTSVPALLWTGFFLVVALAALAAGGWLLTAPLRTG